MSWRPIDFQGIIHLDQKIIDELEQYLGEKENRLAYQILNVIQPIMEEAASPILPIGKTPLKLSEAIDGFNKKVRFFSKENLDQMPSGTSKRVVKEINGTLWEYTEVLESCVIELFQQVRQVPVDRWHLSIAHVVHAIRDILVHRIENLIWSIHRLEKPLKEYCQKCQTKKTLWNQWKNIWEGHIDSHLFHNLKETEKFLKNRYEVFHQRYKEYMGLSLKVEHNLEKMKSYPVLALLDISDQNLYIDVFRLLKVLELNRQPKSEISLETIRSLKHLSSIDHVLCVFRIYYHELKDALFNSSLEWKSFNYEGENFKELLQKLQEKVHHYQQELQQFIHTLTRYRIFMLKTDSDPYISSRWGFTEWIVGPEPPKAKKLIKFIYSAEELNEYFTQFIQALAQDPLTQQRLEYQAHQEIDKILHEMGHPLISRSMMRRCVENLLEQMKICDEIGHPHMSIIPYMEDTLSKAMRLDWKYQVLHEFPLFHQIYHIHQGMVEYFDDPAHAFRLDRFHQLFDQVEEWVIKKDIYAHVNEIELDMNDIKAYLQDFLASVQRAVKEKSHDPFLDETIHKIRQQLMEYRYFFGQFFFVIMVKSKDGQQLRNQFLFVDQYFESIEILINELKMSWEKIP